MNSIGVMLIYFTAVVGHQTAGYKAILEKYLPEDALLNFTQLGTKYRIPVEEYDVVTEDGYILSVFHAVTEKKFKRAPILLQHGILDSADTFILRGNTSLVFTLVRAGYDVWVGNTRGNKYGRRHIKLDPDKNTAFWDFAVNEIGYFDAPAMVDFILTKTGEKKLNVIGHSLGNTMFYVLGSTRPVYNEKINVMIALAPIAFLHHVKPPLADLIGSANLLNEFLKATGQNVILSDGSIPKVILQIVCSQSIFRYEICAQGVILALSGSDPARFEREFLPILIGHYPQACSRKMLLHLVQIARSKTFGQFNYGSVRNLKLYKSVTPPSYDLSKVTMKIALYAAINDKVSTLEDVRLLNERLPTIVEFRVMKPRKWNHLDWVWGRGVNIHFYPYLLNSLVKSNE